MNTSTLQAKIREAYDSVARKSQAWVPLTALRPLVGGERGDVDKALIALIRSGDAVLAPNSCRMDLTAADHEAAIKVGTEMKHLITFD